MASIPNFEKPLNVPAAPASAPPTEAEAEAEVRTADPAGAPPSEAQTPKPSDREDRIREAAYAAYERRGKETGREEDDWLEAERALDAETRKE